MSDNKTFRISMPNERKWVKQEPYVNDKGIWAPYNEYVPEGCESNYKLVMTKEMFVMAYNKWIKGEER